MESARARLGADADRVEWIVGDVTTVALPEAAFDLWHDRAVFHFLTDEADRQRYVRAVLRAVKPGGHSTCVFLSGLDIRAPARARALDEGARLPDVPRMSTPLRILIVEDLPSDVFLLQRALKNIPNLESSVIYEDTLTEALRSIGAGAADLVFLDLHLLDSSGVDTLLAVREAAPSLPVVVVSSSDSPQTQAACRDAGAIEFLAKGQYGTEDLRRVLATLQ